MSRFLLVMSPKQVDEGSGVLNYSSQARMNNFRATDYLLE